MLFVPLKLLLTIMNCRQSLLKSENLQYAFIALSVRSYEGIHSHGSN